MLTSVDPGSGRPRPARYFFPRSQRLYARFDDRTAADAALAAVAEAGFSVGDAWVFEGPEGADELDPGEVAGVARVFAWWLSHNVEYLRSLGRSVREGQVVMGVPARRVDTADDIAPILRAHGGHGLIYTAHGNFVPVSGGSSRP